MSGVGLVSLVLWQQMVLLYQHLTMGVKAEEHEALME
jgi:hypothetical protein